MGIFNFLQCSARSEIMGFGCHDLHIASFLPSGATWETAACHVGAYNPLLLGKGEFPVEFALSSDEEKAPALTVDACQNSIGTTISSIARERGKKARRGRKSAKVTE